MWKTQKPNANKICEDKVTMNSRLLDLDLLLLLTKA